MAGIILAAGLKRVLNWTPGLPTRVARFADTAPTDQVESVLDKMAPIQDQKTLGSCTAFCAQGGFWVAMQTANKTPFLISTLFQYYVERMVEHSVNQDSGATIEDILRAAHRYGIVTQDRWPYDIAKFTQNPPKPVFTEALKERAHSYAPVPLDPGHVQAVLKSHPLMFGIAVYSSFEQTGSDGKIPMPAADETLLGGHAINLVAQNPTNQPVSVPLANSQASELTIPSGYGVIRNSWSADWAMYGYGFMPMEYVYDSGLSSDGWILRII